MITKFVKSILPSTMTIPVLSTSLRIWFNILELNTQRFDITSLGSLSKMVLLLLSLFTLMIRRLIYLPNLLTTNGLNSFAKTLVSSPWIDLSFSSFFLMHLHLVLCITLFNMFLVGYFSVLLYFVFHIKIKKKMKNQKIQKQCLFVYIGTCVPQMAIETKFSKLCIFCCLDEHLYAQLSK